jgi:hypothetical protein
MGGGFGLVLGWREKFVSAGQGSQGVVQRLERAFRDAEPQVTWGNRLCRDLREGVVFGFVLGGISVTRWAAGGRG